MSVFLLGLLASPCLQAQEEIVADGSAMVEGDPVKAKQEALNNAYETALKMTLANLYSEETITANEAKLAKLYKRAGSFITSSKLISQAENTDSGSMEVRVQVTVDSAAVREAMAESGISLSGEKVSTILPLIVERNSPTPDGEGQFWWGDAGRKGFAQKHNFSDIEKALSKYFAQYNFSLIDPYSNELSSNVPESYRYMGLKAPELIKLGQIFGTGLVSNGYVWTTCKRNEAKNQSSCDTNLSLQILSTDTGKVVAAKRSQETGEASSTDEARTISRARACKAVADSLVFQLKNKWDKRPASSYRVVVKGLKDYTKYLNIRRALMGRQVPGYSNVVERYQSKGDIVFEGERRDSPSSIQYNVMSKCFPEGNAKVTGGDDSSVEIQVL